MEKHSVCLAIIHAICVLALTRINVLTVLHQTRELLIPINANATKNILMMGQVLNVKVIFNFYLTINFQRLPLLVFNMYNKNFGCLCYVLFA